ncbi:MAG: Mur ligase, middle domain protein [Haloplasmataceae bacterium]|jgi:poly-gamma-glutamate capsule biosynthesis protein CapA/YwtB (metallophosphatase superfamily)|nr:Mur ligase, middle domain protein [Haloplasmataceae bacterium]
MDIQEYNVLNGEKDHLSIFFGGDTLLGNAAKNIIKQEGYDYPFLKLGELYKSADVRVVNLETPVCENASRITLEKKYKYKMSPNALNVFEKHNFNIFLLANNHSTDCGMEGLEETIDHLNSKKMFAVGAGSNLQEARRAIVINKGDIKVGILNYMNYKPYYDETLNHYASINHGGVNLISEELIKDDIKNLRLNGVNIIIVSIHWGLNYKPITNEQRQLAKLIIEAGADIIVGHGSHQYQPINIIQGKPVFYSIGNFVFNTPGRSPLTYGFPITLHISKNGLNKVEIFPILTNNRIVNYQPIHLTGLVGVSALYELYANSNLGNFLITKLSDRGLMYL